jgi:hypothetical protein
MKDLSSEFRQRDEKSRNDGIYLKISISKILKLLDNFKSVSFGE